LENVFDPAGGGALGYGSGFATVMSTLLSAMDPQLSQACTDVAYVPGLRLSVVSRLLPFTSYATVPGAVEIVILLTPVAQVDVAVAAYLTEVVTVLLSAGDDTVTAARLFATAGWLVWFMMLGAPPPQPTNVAVRKSGRQTFFMQYSPARVLSFT
jgi:hypothetical protein